MFGKTKSFHDSHEGCGVWPLMLPHDHWMTPACMLHDALFDWHHGEIKFDDYMDPTGFIEQHATGYWFVIQVPAERYRWKVDVRYDMDNEAHKRIRADRALLDAAMALSQGKKRRKAFAWACYRIARTLGWIWW